jgi:hypothetical protein
MLAAHARHGIGVLSAGYALKYLAKPAYAV